MADLLEQSSAWLESQRVKHLTRAVTYCRSGNSVAVNATVGKTVFEVDDGLGALEKVESRDFIVATAELVLDGTQTLPQRGDRIRETQGEVTYVYEVMAPGHEPHFRFSDAYRQALRIHTKHVRTE